VGKFWYWVCAGVAVVVLAAVSVLWLTSINPANYPANYSANYKYTPVVADLNQQFRGAFSPDGRSIAFFSIVDHHSRLFRRYLDSSNSIQLTPMPAGGNPMWSADSRTILFVGAGPPVGIWAVAAVGGLPMLVLAGETLSRDLSPDNQTLAVLKCENNACGVWISSPPGAPLRKYEPSPFETKGYFDAPMLRFAPDGRRLLLYFRAQENPDAWLLPYPAGKSRLVLESFKKQFTGFSWMPDSRHVVIAAKTGPTEKHSLWIADVESGDSRELTGGSFSKEQPSVSPDGNKILYDSDQTEYGIVEARLDGTPPKPWPATNRQEKNRSEGMPAWSPKNRQIVYVANRDGADEIWIKSFDPAGERLLVSAKDFPSGPTLGFSAPVFSPDGTRVAFRRSTEKDFGVNRIIPVSGGVPARVTAEIVNEWPPAWSPDGGWLTYVRGIGAKQSLVKVRVGDDAPAVVLQEGVAAVIPSWSPTGEWIACRSSDQGWFLISPDGTKRVSLEAEAKGSPYLLFSKDGKKVYGIRYEQAPDKLALFSLAVETKKESVLGNFPLGLGPSSWQIPGIRFTLSPDGDSFAYGIIKPKTEIWMMEGFQQPGLWNRLAARLRK
jgi:Tol biopolymer transport system component